MTQTFIGMSITSYSSIQIIVRLIKLVKKYKNKKKASKTELENEALDFILINLSGNRLSKKAIDEVRKWGYCKIIEKRIPNLDLSNPITYMENVVNFCGEIIEQLIEKDQIINNLLIGNYIVVPSGMTSIAMTFIAMLHGITGHFPLMSFFYKTGMIYSLTMPFDFQDLRLEYRNFQKSKILLTNEGQEFALVNLSGHFLTPETINEIKRWGNSKIIEKEIPTLELSNSTAYMKNVINYSEVIIKQLIENDQIVNNLLIGNYIVIPSGMTSIAMTFITMLHGITGHFPLMSFFYKTSMRFNLTKPFDFYDLRVKFRNIS